MSIYPNNVFKDSINTLAVRVLNAGLAAALGILTARLLGPAQRGIYILPTLDAALIGAMLSGLMPATSYYMLSARSGSGVLRPALVSAVLLIVAGAVFVAALGIVERRTWSILPAALSLVPTALLAIVSGYCLGISRVRYMNYFNALGSISGIALMALGLTLIAPIAGVAIKMWLASLAVTGSAALLFLCRSARDLRGTPVPLPGFLNFTVKTGASNVLSILNLRADVYIIAALTSPAILGVYTVAVSGAEVLKILTLVLSQTAAPRIGSSDAATSAAFTAKCVRINMLIALVPCFIITIVAPWLLELLYGPRFLPGVPAMRILATGIFASAPSSLLSAYYTIKLGRPMVSFWNCALSAAICCAFSVTLIPKLGMNGAALASTVAYIVSQGVFVGKFVRDTGIPPASVLVVRRTDLRVFKNTAEAITRRLREVRTT